MSEFFTHDELAAEAEGITHADLAAEAEREVKERKRVFRRLVEDGKKSRAQAARQIAMMQAMAVHFRFLAEGNPRANGLLL